MNYIVMDLEWNQPSKKEELVNCPDPLYGEIIQFGAVKMNAEKQITDRFNAIVKPIFYTKMHSKVGQITGIDETELAQGRPFAKVYAEFIDFCGEDFCFLTWGKDDIRIIKSNLKIHGICCEPFYPCYNAQWIYGRQIANTAKQVSLEDAVAALGEPPFQAHDALNDAMSTALVCRHLDLDSGIKESCIKSRKEKNCVNKKRSARRRRRCRRPCEKTKDTDKNRGNQSICLNQALK